MHYKVKIADGWVKMHHNRKEIVAIMHNEVNGSVITEQELNLIKDQLASDHEVIPVTNLQYPIGIFPPEGGWQEQTWYLCEVSYRYGNPVHKCLFYTGFLNKEGRPNGYNSIIQINGGRDSGFLEISDARYLKALAPLVAQNEDMDWYLVK